MLATHIVDNFVVVVVVVAMVAKQIFLYRLAPNELDTGHRLHDGVF